MTCIILAAGYATRLLPITHSFPKPLLPVRGRTVLDLLVDNIGLSERIDRFVVVTNHRNIEYFNIWNRKRKEIISVIDDMTETNNTRLGFVGDLDLAISTLPNEEDLLVVSGSVLFDLNLGEFIEMALKKMQHAFFAVWKIQLNHRLIAGSGKYVQTSLRTLHSLQINPIVRAKQ